MKFVPGNFAEFLSSVPCTADENETDKIDKRTMVVSPVGHCTYSLIITLINLSAQPYRRFYFVRVDLAQIERPQNGFSPAQKVELL